MPALHTTSRVLSLASDPTRSRSAANIFVNEPTSGSLARSKGSLYIVTETEADSPKERAYCRLVADSIRSEYFRDPARELDQSLARGIERGNAKMLKDDRIPPPGERPVVAVTCLSVRDGEVVVAQTLPVQTYIGNKVSIALVPDPPMWERPADAVSPALFIGHEPRVSYQLYSASLNSGDMVAICSSALAQSLPAERLEQWLSSGEMRFLTQGMRANYLRSDTEPAYALIVQARPDVREKTAAPEPDGTKGRGGVVPLAGSLASTVLRRGASASAGSARRSDPSPGPNDLPRATLGRRPGPGSGEGASRQRRTRRPVAGAANRRLAMGAGAVIAAIIVLILLVKGVHRFQSAREHAAFLRVSTQVDALLTAATQQKDAAAAMATLQQAQGLIQQDRGELSTADVAILSSRVAQREDLLDKASRLSNVKVLANVNGDPTAQFAQVALQGANVFILDTGGRRVLKVPAGGGPPVAAMSAGIRVGADTIQPLVAIAPDASGVLAVDSSNAVWSFDAGNNQIRRVVMPGANAWGEIRAIATYRDDIYVLDSKAGRIWRYTPQGTGYGPPVDYLPAGGRAATPVATPTAVRGQPTATPAPTATPVPPPDLLHSVDLAVDGSVYLLQTDGHVLRYTNGLPQPFPEHGLVGSMPSPSHIITSVSDSSVYVVDPSGSRIVRFSSDGEFERQYLLPANKPAPLTGIQSATLDAAHGLVYLISAKAVAVATLPNQ